MAQDDQPVYNQAFYASIITERRKLGAVGYVDIDECMRVVGRDWDNSPTDENERPFVNKSA